jgi:hypothetical protein
VIQPNAPQLLVRRERYRHTESARGNHVTQRCGKKNRIQRRQNLIDAGQGVATKYPRLFADLVSAGLLFGFGVGKTDRRLTGAWRSRRILQRLADADIGDDIVALVVHGIKHGFGFFGGAVFQLCELETAFTVELVFDDVFGRLGHGHAHLSALAVRLS